MNRNAGESAVDRLIALAQQKPARPDTGAMDDQAELEPVPLALPSARELEHNPMESAAAVAGLFALYRTVCGDEHSSSVAAVDRAYD
jgi:hypothetical protein